MVRTSPATRWYRFSSPLKKELEVQSKDAVMLRSSDLVSLRNGRAIFDPVTLALAAGDALEVVGPNGAGKTTLMRTLAGLHGQFAGTFHAASLLFQGHRLGLDELLTPLENIRWHAELDGRELADDVLADALNKVAMAGYAFTPVGKLSQGQQRRVAMARWLCAERRLWLLDEPVTALDDAGQSLLCSVLDEHLAAGGAVMYSTHVALAVTSKRALRLRAAGI